MSTPRTFPASGLRRAARRLLAGLVPPRAELAYSPLYTFRVPGGLHDPDRGERILTFLSAESLVHPQGVFAPEPVSWEELRSVHSDTYLESLHLPGALARVFGARLSDAQEDHLLETQRAMVAGTAHVVERALARRGVAVNLGGGLHHAQAGRGSGFCLFNDVAVAVRRLRRGGFAGRVLVVDLDLHDGDGTRAIFAEDESVHTFSIHNADWGPTAAAASTSVALGGEVDDRRFLEELSALLPPVLESFRPELAIYLAGCDPAADDRLGNWRLTARGMLERDERVFGWLRDRSRAVPLAVLLAGGYGEQAWRYSARFLSWALTGGRAIEPPTSEEITLERYRRLARGFSPRELQGEPDEGWSITYEDLAGALGALPQETRFLGYYSRQGIELALERLGFLAKLRELGFAHPTLTFELDNPGGQTVRLFGDRARRALLVELRVRRDRRTVPDHELLAIEWLLAQNPRARFTAARPPLPGQRAPGLGVLRDVMTMLVLICDRLRLSGVLFSPSHYHLAAQAHERLVFLDPAAEARYRALGRALSGLPLGEASRAVDAGRVVDEASGQPVRWQGTAMVLPVAEDLRERIASADWQEELARVERGLRYRLAPAPETGTGSVVRPVSGR